MVGAIAAWIVAGTASAGPLFFDGPDGFGVGAEAARAAEEGMDLSALTARGLERARGIVDVTRQDVLDYELTDPPSRDAPITATSHWTVENASGSRLDDLWLVIFAATTYTPMNVGLELDDDDGWALLATESDGATYYYPAIHLGQVAAGESVAFDMRHRVAEPLQVTDDQLLLPRFGIGVDRTLAPAAIPEPSSLLLCTSSLALLFVAPWRRR
jgi:hypothetical protein